MLNISPFLQILKVLAFWWEIETDNSVQPASRTLASIPGAKEDENLAGDRTNNLALAGFSLAALTSFLTFAGHPSGPTITNTTITKVAIMDTTITDTSFYLSVSLVCPVIAAYMFGIRISRAFSYAADTFEALGLSVASS